jgi:hypothetical protein
MNIWITEFLDLPIVWYWKEDIVSETGSISILRWKGGRPTLLGPLERATSVTGRSVL